MVRAMVCAAAVLCGAGPCLARVVVHQTKGGNVFGYVQVGPGPSTVEVRQDGAHNIAGIVQVSPNATVDLRQSGRSNASAVFQGSLPAGMGRPGAMP